WRIAKLNSNLDTLNTNLWPIRQAVLEGDTSIAARNTRNETAHGGNVIADVELIGFMEKVDLPRANAWEKKKIGHCIIIIIIIIIHTRICQPCLAEWRQVQRGGRVSRRSGNH